MNGDGERARRHVTLTNAEQHRWISLLSLRRLQDRAHRLALSSYSWESSTL